MTYEIIDFSFRIKIKHRNSYYFVLFKCFIIFNGYSNKMKKKILVMDKDDAILEIVCYVLKDAGYDVKPLNAENGIYDQIFDYKPDAILLDIVTPTPKGTEVCNTLKTNAKTKHIPVIVYSTHPKVTQTIKQVCADEVLPKPFDIDELLGVIETYVAR